MRHHTGPSAVVVAVVSLFFLAAGAIARAEDSFYRVPVKELKIVQGSLPQGQAESSRAPSGGMRVLIDGDRAGIEAYAAPADVDDGHAGSNWSEPPDQWAVFVRAPQGKAIAGRFEFAKPEGQGTQTLSFEIPASSAAASNRAHFLHAKAWHYEMLMSEDIPGGAWFRQQAQEAHRALGDDKSVLSQRQTEFAGNQDLSDTYGLFTGGRAVSENLQLDRVLPASTQPQREETSLSAVHGLDVKAIDWKPIVQNLHPQLDPLAGAIPADQHAVFFPSPEQLAAVVAVAEKHATPALQSLEPQAQTLHLRERYERQMCNSLDRLVELSRGGLIRSVAVTGSDPYLRVGTDIALLFETSDPEKLSKELAASMTAAKGAQADSGEEGGLKFTGAVSPDRSVSAYVAVIGGDVVVLTNSREQLRQLAAVKSQSAPALSSQPEYLFFRDRYVRGKEDESALLVLSDATIRRWCGPRWRIADSRRTRAAAVLSELTAENTAAIVGGEAQQTKTLQSDRFVPQLGGLRLTAASAGVQSSTYNTLAFMTPISELKIEKVTQAEADAYGRWRDSYQQNWSWAFDPIALRLSLPSGGEIAGDLTVMPLIDASQFGQFMQMSRGVQIKPGTGDPHDGTLFHYAYAINVHSPMVMNWSNVAAMSAPQLKLNPFDWLGPTVALYGDDDPFWKELSKAETKDDFLTKNLGRLPVGLYAQVNQPLKLAAFLTGARAFIEQSAPNLTQWQSPQYRGRTYVKIEASAGEMLGEGAPQKVGIYYVTSPDSLDISLNEDLLKRAIDRQLARETAASQPAAPAAAPAQATTAPATQPWLGKNLALQVDRRMIDVLATLDEDNEFSSMTQRLAWANIPILNEWKRLYPDRDPLEVHEQLWHVRLTDPAGGSYVWNEKWQTMESTGYGHPGEPKKGPAMPPGIGAFSRGNFGVDFEEHGIRARAKLTAAAATQPAN